MRFSNLLLEKYKFVSHYFKFPSTKYESFDTSFPDKYEFVSQLYWFQTRNKISHWSCTKQF